MALSDTARRLLSEFGDAVVASFETGGATNAATGDVITPPTPASLEGAGYLGNFKSNEINGTSILDSDMRLVLEKIATRPEVGWRCTTLGVVYRVINCRRIRYKGDDVIYIVQLRT